MDPIRVPGPPPQAFRKNRPISDLIKAQIKHFQHLEHKLQLNLPTKFSPHDLTTEAAAARYIAEMTTALCSQTSPSRQAPTPITTVPSKPKAPAKPSLQSRGIPLAAAAATTPRGKKSTSAKPAKKRS